MAVGSLRQRFATWLFRDRGPEASPIVLVHRRVFVLPTRAGLAFGAALVVMLLAAINYQLSLGYALTFLLAGLGHAAILNTFRNLARLEIGPVSHAPVFAGEDARFVLRLGNPRASPRYALDLTVGECREHVAFVGADDAAIATLRLPTRRRGWLQLPRVTLETRFPLGLIRAWGYAQPDMRVLVWPRPEAHPPPLPHGAGHAGGIAASARGSDDFAGLRNYQPGDSPRHIAWKASSGDGPLMTKQFAGAQAGEVVLRWADLPATLAVEARLARLAAWVCAAHAQGLAWRLELPGTVLRNASGPAHREACLNALALFGEESPA